MASRTALYLSGLLALACSGCGAGATRAPEPKPATERAPATAVSFSERELARILRHSPLAPPPPDPTNRFADDPAAARFGQAVFFDRRFSKSGETACVSCHDPELGWADGRRLGQGVTELNRNTMSLWNVAYNRWLFWDGRTDSLWAQALQPLENPLEHAFTRLQVAHLVARDPALRRSYEEVFGELPALEDGERFPPVGRPVPPGEGHGHVAAPAPSEQTRDAARGLRPRSGHMHRPGQGFYHPHQRAWDAMHAEDQEAVTRVFVHVGKAIAAFERRILSRAAPFDRFVEGLRDGDAHKLAALSESAQRGLQLFVGRGNCHLCHSGPNFSDLEFHDVGVPDLEAEMPLDEGRLVGLELLRKDPFNGIGRWSDAPEGEARLKLDYLPEHGHNRAEFKTPSLRNVALTAPYHHQGQFASLEEVVEFYSSREGVRTKPPVVETLLKPLHLSASEQADLAAFLHALTDDSLAPELRRAPRLEPAAEAARATRAED